MRFDRSSHVWNSLLLALLAGVWGCVAPRLRLAPERAAPRLDAAETDVALVLAHNDERARRGLPPLASNPRLTAAARRHADDMAARRRMSHRGGDGSSPFQRMRDAGFAYASAAENVAHGQATVAEVMGDWMRSPGHRRNILGRFTEIGTAYAIDARGTPCWCVTFGRASDHSEPAPPRRRGYP